MGHSMTQTAGQFRLRRVNFAAALAAVRALAEPSVMKDWASGMSTRGGVLIPNYAWVSTHAFAEAPNLVAAISAWRWTPVVENEGEGDIVGLRFAGEKLGDDEHLFHALAPFVEPGSFLQMVGEDGERWQWRFEDGRVREIFEGQHFLEA